MKRWLLVLLIFTGIFPLYSQSLPQYFDEWWDRIYYVSLHGLGVDSQSNVYVGYSDTTDVYFLKKMDASGNDLWIDTVDVPFTWLYTTSDGTIYTAGNLTPSDLILATWNSEGTKLWQDTFHTPFDTCAFKKIWVNTHHEAFLAGFSDTHVLWIARYDSMGEIMDTVSIGLDSTFDYYDVKVAFDDSGNAYILAYYVNDTDSIYKWITEKYDVDGTLLWSSDANVSSFSGIGQIYVVSSHVYSVGMVVGGTSGRIVVLKYSKEDGNLIDSIYFSLDEAPSGISAVVADDSENIYIGGETWGPVGFYYGVIIKFNSQGDSVWGATVSDGEATTVLDLAVDTHSDIYALLEAGGRYFSGGVHLSVVKYTSSAGVEEQAGDNSGLIVNVPAIVKDNIKLTYNVKRPGAYSIEVYSVDGRCISKVFDKRIGTHHFTVDNLKGGIYFVRLQQDREYITKKVIVEK